MTYSKSVVMFGSKRRKQKKTVETQNEQEKQKI